MGRIFLIAGLALAGLVDASTMPPVPNQCDECICVEPIAELALTDFEEAIAPEVVSTEVVADVPAAPPEEPAPKLEVIPPEDSFVSAPCANGACARVGPVVNAAAAPVRLVGRMLQNGHERRVDRRDARRERWANRPRLFGRRC